jgi:hypothetical protein
LRVGDTTELIRRLYIFYRPYLVTVIRHGEAHLFNQEPSSLEEKFLDGSPDIDQIADVSKIDIYELSAPYIIRGVAEQLRKHKKEDTSGIDKITEKQLHITCKDLHEKLKGLATSENQVIPFFTVKESHEIVKSIIDIIRYITYC